MAEKSGKDGTIKLSAVAGVPAAIINIKNWKITRAATVTKQGTNSSGGFKTAVAGVKDWSLTFDQYLDDTVALSVVEGESYDVELHIDGTDSNYISGTIVAETVDGPETDMDEGVTMMASVTAQGSGAYTLNGNI